MGCRLNGPVRTNASGFIVAEVRDWAPYWVERQIKPVVNPWGDAAFPGKADT